MDVEVRLLSAGNHGTYRPDIGPEPRQGDTPMIRVATRSRPARILTYSALALVLAATPVAFDLQNGGFHLSSAHAKSCFVAGTRVRMANPASLP